MVASSSTGDIVNKKKKANAFPKLMKSLTGTTILFDEYGEGVVVHKGKLVGEYAVGHYSTDWDMSVFKETDETITLCSKRIM